METMQAARALECYQGIVLKEGGVDFEPIKSKLTDLSKREKLQGGQSDSKIIVKGKGNEGIIDPSQPEVIRKLQGRMRVLNQPRSTEKTYLSWVRKFIRHLDDDQLEKYGEAEIADFLTELAITKQVVAGTQNQAYSALKYLYQNVYGRELRFVNSLRAKESSYLPGVLTKNEITELMKGFSGQSRKMFSIMYGRHRLC